MQPIYCSKLNISPQQDARREKLEAFRAQVQDQRKTGREHETCIQDIHACLQQKEILEGCCGATLQATAVPIEGHDITKEYRTKMMDWMVEVCTSFKCSSRAYFLATQIFDKYLCKMSQAGRRFGNKEVHGIGVVAMYLASKYEDIFPLHSRIVSEKIAHKALSANEILKREKAFLDAFDYDIDLVTHYDFIQTYSNKIERLLSPEICPNQASLLSMARQMALLLVKMSLQSIDFCSIPQSIVVLACFFAATAFLKHSTKHQGP